MLVKGLRWGLPLEGFSRSGVEGCGDELGAHVVGHGPTDHGATGQVDDGGQVSKAPPGPLGDVGDPQPVGGGCREARLDQVGWALGRQGWEGRPSASSPGPAR